MFRIPPPTKWFGPSQNKIIYLLLCYESIIVQCCMIVSKNADDEFYCWWWTLYMCPKYPVKNFISVHCRLKAFIPILNCYTLVMERQCGVWSYLLLYSNINLFFRQKSITAQLLLCPCHPKFEIWARNSL